MIVGIVARDTGSPLLAVAAGLIVGAGMGLTNGLLVRFLKINPLIVTLAMNLIWGGLAFATTSGEVVFGLKQSFIDIGTVTFLGVASPVWVAMIVFTVGGYFLVATIQGLRVYAIGGNAEAARLVGIKVERTVVSLYVINSTLVGVVAILTTARLSSASPQVGLTFSLDVLTAIILGGIAFSGGSGHPIGVLIGILTLGILDAGLIFAGFEDWYQQMARGGILLLALAADQVLAHRREFGKARDTSTVADVPGSAISDFEASVPDASDNRVGEMILEGTGLAKSYGPVTAVASVDFAVKRGEIACLVGDNGAGKSTLVKMISGAVRPDTGTVLLRGQPLPSGDPAAHRAAGLQTVYQDLALCPNLSVVHNLILGEEPARRGFRWLGLRDDAAGRQRATDRLERFGVTLIDLDRLVSRLSGGQRQSVSIARALKPETDVIILDEPTAALGIRQTARVLSTVKAVAQEGTAVVFVSHDLESVFAVADRVLVLRQGRVAFDGPINELSRTRLVHMMAGLGDPLSAAPNEQDPSEDGALL